MCIFCKIINHEIPSNIVYEDDDVLAILDAGPLNPGHTLVMPKKHVTSMLEADDETTTKVMTVVNHLSKKITKAMDADGCNILANCNEAAGQSVDHMHVHIIPRHLGDNTIVLNSSETKEDPNVVLAKIHNS